MSVLVALVEFPTILDVFMHVESRVLKKGVEGDGIGKR